MHFTTSSAALLVLVLVLVAAVAACSKPAPAGHSDLDATAEGRAAAAPLAADVHDATAPAAEPPPRAPKTYARVLHTGDSMVGGGLARALRPKFVADGTKYHRDVIESGTVHEFAQSAHLPALLAKIEPDLILLTLGANHVPHSTDPETEIGPYLRKLLKRVEGIDCYWVAPPIWKPSQAKFNRWLAENVAPCRFYDASEVEIARRPDKIHPNEEGGEAWADDFWRFYKGEGAFFEESARPTDAGGAR